MLVLTSSNGAEDSYTRTCSHTVKVHYDARIQAHYAFAKLTKGRLFHASIYANVWVCDDRRANGTDKTRESYIVNVCTVEICTLQEG
jgi:hypothetical protein